MKKSLLAGILVLLVGGFLFATAGCGPEARGTIKGTVSDADNAAVYLGGVKVTLEETEASVVTDEFGEFRFKNLKPGVYTLTLKKSKFFPKTSKAKVEPGKVSTKMIQLSRQKDLFSDSQWTKETSKRIRDLLWEQGMRGKRIAIAFYISSGSNQCELPDMVIRFATEFNKQAHKEGNTVVVRDARQAGYLINELKNQHQFKIDFDPATVAQIGKKLGADVVIIGALIEKREFFEPLVNGTSVEKQAYIPGLSINDILMKKGAIRCN